MIANAVRSILIADSSVAAALGSQVYCGAAPQSLSGTWAVVQRIGDVAVNDSDGPTGLTRAVVQVSIWSGSEASADTACEACRLAIQGAATTADNVEIQRVTLENQRDSYEPPSQGQGVGYFSRQLDLGIWYQQAVPA